MKIEDYFKLARTQKWTHAFLGFSFAFSLTAENEEKILPIIGLVASYIYLLSTEKKSAAYEKKIIIEDSNN